MAVLLERFDATGRTKKPGLWLPPKDRDAFATAF
jgi:hypothetical protein